MLQYECTRKSDPKKYSRLTEKRCRDKARTALFVALGEKCARCGFSDIRALQVDHVNGGGKIDRNGRSSANSSYWRKILVRVQEGSKEYQLLCSNCNWIKRDEKHEHGGLQLHA